MAQTESKNNTKTLFSKKFGNYSILKALINWQVNELLDRNSKQFIADNKKQLVVFSFDYIAHKINLYGIYEWKELATFFEWIKEYKDIFNGTAIDIGANIGNHSLFFSDYFQKVISFEPNLRTFKVLSINSELANNIICFNVGISSSDRDGQLSINSNNIGNSSISTTSTSNSQSIQLRTLDSIIEHDEKIKLIKIDVEGHEYDALLGSERIIKNNMPIILFEQHHNDFVNGRSKVINLLVSYGYAKFASIKTYPRSPSYFGVFFQRLYALFSKKIVGESMRIQVQTSFEPDTYAFIIAIPDWLDIQNN